MTKNIVQLDIDKLEKELEEYKRKVQELELLIKAAKSIKAESPKTEKISAVEQATRIAEDMLKQGLVIKKTSEFKKKIDEAGILTRNGRQFTTSVLSAVLGLSGRVRYNREEKVWELVKK